MDPINVIATAIGAVAGYALAAAPSAIRRARATRHALPHHGGRTSPEDPIDQEPTR